MVRDAPKIEKFLVQWDLVEPAGLRTYVHAADLNRQARSHALTLTTADALISRLAIENGLQLFTLGKGFARMVHRAPLELHLSS